MKKLIMVWVLCLSASMAFAQWGEEDMPEKPSFRDRVFTGGGLGASFSSYYSSISLSPLVGVVVVPRLATGVQFTYRWSQYKYSSTPNITTNDYGVSPFVRFNVFGPLFLHAEYEYLNYEFPSTVRGDTEREGFSSFMAGGGLFQPVGRHAGLYLLALYNFNYGPNTPYDSPVVLRAGITAGF